MSTAAIEKHPLPPYQGTGLLLSITNKIGSDLYTYVFNDNQNPNQMNAAFLIFWDCELEDMDCGRENEDEDEEDGGPCKVAWVGNNTSQAPPHTAEYLRTDISIPYALPTSALNITFLPYNYADDPSGYYSLHKVHYFPNDDPDAVVPGDNQFHAGGYHQSGEDDDNSCGKPGDRTTFAVTPESVPASVPCKQQINRPTLPKNTIIPLEFFVGPVRVYAKPLPELTRWYGFCTMDCEGKRDDNCGNRKIEK
ncbi:MAG: hypothetical protein FWH36_04255 [Lentimicrobiaceae bacterium]|nr:hypothetical protein [Lentimicrobiaceae bacterium]